MREPDGGQSVVEKELHVEVARDNACAAQGRRIVAEHLSDLGSDERRENKFRRCGGHVRIEVIDQGRPGAVRIKDRTAELGGWGLRIVDQLTSDWGVFEGRTHVWATLPVG